MGADEFVHTVGGFKDNVREEFAMLISTTDVAEPLALPDFLS